MPSAQVINFGEDPYANAMGGFARNFLTTFNEKTGQKRNEDLFKRISDKYGADANPEDIVRDVIKAEGFDQDYKRNKLKELTDLAGLQTKKNKSLYEQVKNDQILDIRNKELTERSRANDIADRRQQTEDKKIEVQKKKNEQEYSKELNNYTSKILKDSNIDLDAEDKSALNYLTSQYEKNPENPMPREQAFEQAFKQISNRRDTINEGMVIEKPTNWSFTDTNTIDQAKEQAVKDIERLYDEQEITSQKDLRAILKRSRWSPKDVNDILQVVFTRKDRKFRPIKDPSAQQSANIPFQQQGVASQAAGLDDILFGE